MTKDLCFRLHDAVGPDYKCSKCNTFGYRLWRDSHVMLSAVDLYCAECAEIDQAVNIEKYKASGIHDDNSCTIGNLLPARPTPDGSTFWGSSSGDSAWWSKLPQYKDPERESKLVRRERDELAARAEDYGSRWLKAEEEASKYRRERDEAFRVAKLADYPT